MAWYVAPALETLRLQLNKAFPKRSKASDGGIGDAKHASRSSDHNPWVKDKKGTGVVTARDFTHDPKTGIDCEWLADTLVKNKDPRIKYIIWNRQICSSKTSPWKWRKYSGANAHTKHLHLSVNSEEKHWSNKTPWDLDFPDDAGDDVAKVTKEPEQDSAARPASPATSAGTTVNSTEKPDQIADAYNPLTAAQPIEQTPPAPEPPPPLVTLTDPVAVEQVSAEREADKEVSGIGASMAGATTFITTTLGGLFVFLQGYGWQIVVGLAIFGGLFVLARFWYASSEKQRKHDERMERERQAHALQLALIEAGSNPNRNTVVLTPPPVTVLNSETGGTASE